MPEVSKIKRKIIAAVLLAAAILGGISARNAQKAADPQRADGCAYVVKEYNGMIAVFQNGSNLPDEILDCPLDSLPPEEVQRLKNGIPVFSEQELQKLIEAFD